MEQRVEALRGYLASPVVRQACELLAPYVRYHGYERPLEKPVYNMFDQPTKQIPKTSRVVADAADCEAQVAKALKATRPSTGIESVLEADLHKAIADVSSFYDHPEGLQQHRNAALHRLHQVKRMLIPVNANIVQLIPPSILPVAKNFNWALVHVLVVVTGWPDQLLVQNLCLGFNVKGDIPDSGVFRPLRKDATLSHETFDKVEWTRQLHASMEARAAEWDSKRLDIETQCYKKTLNECQDSKYCRGPYTLEQILAEYPDGVWGARRFGVLQGSDYRPIDDHKESGQNASCSMKETIVCESAELPARIGAGFYKHLKENCILEGGTEDWTKAYRQLPVADRDCAVVAQVNPVTRKVEFFVLYGHCFGQVAAVVNFNRVAKFATMVARRIVMVACGHYFDDGVIVEPTYARRLNFSCKFCYTQIHVLLGFELDYKNKSVPMAHKCTFVGVTTNFTRAPRGEVLLCIKEGRAESVTAEIRAVLDAHKMPRGFCDRMHGKLQFSCTTAYGKVGVAALQPIIRGKTKLSGKYAGSLPKDISHACQFFVALLSVMPPRRIRLCRTPLSPLLVWSDASYEHRIGRLGFVSYKPNTNYWYHSALRVPSSIIKSFVRKKQYIGQCEILAAACVYFTFPDLCRGREILHWIDNDSALQGLKKGYSPKSDSARLIHAFHMFNAGLNNDVWFEYVESKANIADAPSRFDFAWLHSRESTFRPMIVPEAKDFMGGFEYWFSYASGGYLRAKIRSRATTKDKRARRRARMNRL